MKLFASILVTLASSAALAYPAVGDMTISNGTYTINGQSYPMVVKQEILARTAHSFSVRGTFILNGESQIENQQIESNRLSTRQEVKILLANCGKAEGTLETITVPAGTFETCHFKYVNDQGVSEVWMGDVPFQNVRQIQTSNQDGSVINIALTEYKNGL